MGNIIDAREKFEEIAKNIESVCGNNIDCDIVNFNEERYKKIIYEEDDTTQDTFDILINKIDDILDRNSDNPNVIYILTSMRIVCSHTFELIQSANARYNFTKVNLTYDKSLLNMINICTLCMSEAFNYLATNSEDKSDEFLTIIAEVTSYCGAILGILNNEILQEIESYIGGVTDE